MHSNWKTEHAFKESNTSKDFTNHDQYHNYTVLAVEWIYELLRRRLDGWLRFDGIGSHSLL